MTHANQKAVTFQVLGMINRNQKTLCHKPPPQKNSVQNSNWSKEVEISRIWVITAFIYFVGRELSKDYFASLIR